MGGWGSFSKFVIFLSIHVGSGSLFFTSSIKNLYPHQTNTDPHYCPWSLNSCYVETSGRDEERVAMEFVVLKYLNLLVNIFDFFGFTF